MNPPSFFLLAAIRKTGGVAAALMLTGCVTMTSYSPKVTGAAQTLKYTQGVGTLMVKETDHEVYMYPTFRAQAFTEPTFTIGYANNAEQPFNFTTANIKAFFRGAPVPIYTYLEKTAEIESQKRGQQIALAILGGAAAIAAARSASRTTYTSNYSGAVFNNRGSAGFSGSNVLRVYDPASGMIAGAAVGGATAIGIQQIEYSANAKQDAALAILQDNTVEPKMSVFGNIIVKECCDQFSKPGDSLRFEVTVNAKTHIFEFDRLQISSK